MVEIRPVWGITQSLGPFEQAELNQLLAIEKDALTDFDLCTQLARIYVGDEQVNGLTFLYGSARIDLVAGCELARAGYLKQAYSLWRSWFEQSLFFLYFLEAPVHKEAWKVSAQVSLDDSPPYRLMLHQLLAESGEKHAFSLVYNDRFTRVTAALRLSVVPKVNRPIARATKILTTLSQGVHGTYQPTGAASLQECCVQLTAHCLPVLKGGADLIALFWLLLLTTYIDMPPDMLVKLRECALKADSLGELGLEGSEMIAKLGPLFSRAFTMAA